MLVIEGYAGKSLAIGEYLETLDYDDVVLICSANRDAFKHLDYKSIKPEVLMLNTGTELLEDTLQDIKKGIDETVYRFTHVVLYANTTRNKINLFKKFETDNNFKVILTVQTPDSENPREVSKYTV